MKRKKKYNRNKVVNILTNNALENFCVLNINNHNGFCKLINIKTNSEVVVTPYLHKILTEKKYKWSIYIAGFGFDNKNRYTKSKIVISDKPYLQTELIEFLNLEHQKLLKSFNPSHLVGYGWLASSSGYDFDEKEAFNLFDKHGQQSQK